VIGISLDTTDVILSVGNTETLIATIEPQDAANPTIIWSSTNDSIASVDNYGVVTAHSEGIVTITATAQDGGHSASATVSVVIPVVSVLLNYDYLNLMEGEYEVLLATIIPSDATNPTVIWSSSDELVATVSNDGTVLAQSVGTSVITVTVTTDDGSVATAESIVNVGIPVTGISLNKNVTFIGLESTETLYATIHPADASNQTIIWRSSDESIVSVDNDGVITTYLIEGYAIITAESEDGNFTAYCVVNVLGMYIAVEGISFARSYMILSEGDTEFLETVLTPYNATVQGLIWVSDDDSIVRISGGGTAFAVTLGVANVSVTTIDGGYTDSIAITVLPKVATPTANPLPQPGLSTGGFSVTLFTPTTDAVIHYTTDGTEPTEYSAIFSSPIEVTETTTIRARAFRTGMGASDIASFLYAVAQRIDMPTANIESGVVDVGTEVIFTSDIPDAVIRFTTNGTEPNEHSRIFTQPIVITNTTTIKARAFRSGMIPSDTATFEYYVRVSAPIALPNPEDTIESGSAVILTSLMPGAVIRYTLDGTEPTLSSPVFSAPIVITDITTITAKATLDGWTDSEIMVFTYSSVRVAPPVANLLPGVVSHGTGIILSSVTPDSTIRFTTDGTMPNQNSPIFSTPIAITRSTLINARAFKDGLEPSDVATFQYDVRLFPPFANPPSGTVLASGDRVTLTSVDSTATILYTIDGSYPCESNDNTRIYNNSLILNSATTIRAKAVRSDMPDRYSDIVTFVYTVASRTSPPRAVPGNTNAITAVNAGHVIYLDHNDNNVEIFFTLTPEGSTPRIPTIHSTRYNPREGIRINFPATITAIAVSQGMAISEPVSFRYTVDRLETQDLWIGGLAAQIPDNVMLVGGNHYSINLNNIPSTVFFDHLDGTVKVIIGEPFGRPWGEGRDHDARRRQYAILRDSLIDYSRNVRGALNFSTLRNSAGVEPFNFLLRNNIGMFVPQHLHGQNSGIIGFAEGSIPQHGEPISLRGMLFVSHDTNPNRLETATLFTLSDPTGTILFDFEIERSLLGTDIVSYIGDIDLRNMRQIVPERELRVYSGRERTTSYGIRALYQEHIVNEVRLNGIWNPGNDSFSLRGTTWRYHYNTAFFGLLGSQNTSRGPFLNERTTFWLTQQASPRAGFSRLDGSVYNGVHDLRNFSFTSRDYLGTQSEWLGSTPAGNADMRILQRSVAPETAPIITEIQGIRVMFFIVDDGSRDSMNRATLMFSIYNALNNTWSVPQAVHDDGTNDFTFSIASDGIHLWVTWLNSNRVFEQNVTIDEILAASEIAVARFDVSSQTFMDAEFLTNDTMLNHRPVIALSGEQVVVAWIQNENNDFFGNNGYNNAIIARQLTDGVWSQPVIVNSGLGVVADMDVSHFGGQFQIAYVIDSDNNLSTRHDRTLIVQNLSGVITNTPVINKSISNLNFTFINGVNVLSWHESEISTIDGTDWENGNIRYMTASGHIQSLFDVPSMFNNNYRIVSNANGNTAILYPHSANGMGFMLARTQHDGIWGNSFVLAETGDFARFFDVVLEDDGEFTIVYNNFSMMTIGEGDQSRHIRTSDLCMLRVRPIENLALIRVNYDEHEVRLGQPLQMSVDIVGTGGVPVNSVDIFVNDSAIGTFAIPHGLLSGESASIDFNLDMPVNMVEQTDFVISVVPSGQTNLVTDTNSRTITLGRVLLILLLEKQYNDDDTVTIFANVENSSDFSTDARLVIRQGVSDGRIVDVSELGIISGRQNMYSEFIVNPDVIVSDGMPYGLMYFELISSSSSNMDFVVIFANEARVYDILLNPSADVTFSSATLGYDVQTPHSILLNNTGNQETEVLAITLSGENASSFTLNRTVIPNIALNGFDSFTITPNVGLSVGTYIATVTVSGVNVGSRSLNVSFTVTDKPKFNATIANGGIGVLGNGSFAIGTVVSIYPGIRNGYIFDGWVSSDVVFTNAKNPSTTFVMPENDVLITATWRVYVAEEPPITPPVTPPTVTPPHPPIVPPVTETPPDSSVNAFITPTNVSFDIVNQSDISVTFSGGSYRLQYLRIGNYTLVRDRDYTIIGNRIIIHADFLTTLHLGEHTIIFEMNGGSNPRLRIRNYDSSQLSYSEYRIYMREPEEVEEQQEPQVPPITPPDLEPTFGTVSEPGGTRMQWIPPVPQFTFDIPHACDIFNDIANDAWYYDFVGTVVNYGLFSGMGDGIFAPQCSMTRAMFAQVLANLQGVDISAFGGQGTFDDVDTDTWYSAAVEWAAYLEIVVGVGDNNFAPNAPITREEMAVILHRFITSMGINLQSEQVNDFADQSSISYWAVESVGFIHGLGIITGRPNRLFDPQSPATRAEVATIFARLLEIIIQ